MSDIPQGDERSPRVLTRRELVIARERLRDENAELRAQIEDLRDADTEYRVQISELDKEIAKLRKQVAEHEGALTWGTSCLACSKVLDSSIKETFRAEKAEEELAKLRAQVEDLKQDTAKLSALESAGVDNWQGYDYAMAILRGEEN